MKAVYKRLLEQSEHAALAAIEIYNKPDFKYREESFVILLINAWELLLKARILKESGSVKSIYVRYGPTKRQIKKSRCGNPLTIELFGAAKKLNLDQVVVDNLEMLTEIRDTCVHFHPSEGLKEMVFNLGAAALRNYATLVQKWFSRALSQYDFFILPMGFSHGFLAFDGDGIAGTPKELERLLEGAKKKQEGSAGGSGEFLFACEIDVCIRSSKKFTATGAATVSVDQNSTAATVIIQEKRKLDQYPLSYREVVTKVKERLPKVKQGQIDAVIKKEGVKSNTRLASYSFLKKADENLYLTKGEVKPATTCIYNYDAVEFICQRLQAASV